MGELHEAKRKQKSRESWQRSTIDCRRRPIIVQLASEASLVITHFSMSSAYGAHLPPRQVPKGKSTKSTTITKAPAAPPKAPVVAATLKPAQGT